MIHRGRKLAFAEENGKSGEFKCSRPHGFKAGFPQKFSLIKVSIVTVGLCLGFGGYVKVGLILCDTIPKVPKESIIEIFWGKIIWHIYISYTFNKYIFGEKGQDLISSEAPCKESDLLNTATYDSQKLWVSRSTRSVVKIDFFRNPMSSKSWQVDMMSQQRSPQLSEKRFDPNPTLKTTMVNRKNTYGNSALMLAVKTNKNFKLLTAVLWVDLDNYKSSKKEVKRWILARLSQHMKIPLYAHSKFDRVDNKDVNHTRPYLNFIV